MHPTLTLILIVLGSLAAVAVLVTLAVLFMLAPGRRNAELDKYKSVKYAHRGLHDGERAENSLSAFAAAKSEGYGIELDVRLSRGGELVVFHDATLERMTGACGRVIDYTADELKRMNLRDTGEGIPTFREVLRLIDGAVPLLIEIKQDTDESGVAERFIEEIRDYCGDYIVESFNPMALRVLRRARPDILRGILSMNYMKNEKYRGKLLYRLLGGLYLNFLMRPDFIAFNREDHSMKNLRYVRRAYGTPLFAWTVRSEEEELRALGDGFDTVIFEGYHASK